MAEIDEELIKQLFDIIQKVEEQVLATLDTISKLEDSMQNQLKITEIQMQINQEVLKKLKDKVEKDWKN